MQYTYYIIVKRHFDAAHFLRDYQGKCANTHGHTWEVCFYFKCLEMDRGYSDIIVDFKDLHEEIDKNLPDHKFLNEIYPFNPTAENLAKYFFDFYSVLVMEKKWPVRLSRVEVWESPSSCAAYEAE